MRSAVTVHRRRPYPLAIIHRIDDRPAPTWEWVDDTDWSFPLTDRARARKMMLAWRQVGEALIAGHLKMMKAAQRAFGAEGLARLLQGGPTYRPAAVIQPGEMVIRPALRSGKLA